MATRSANITDRAVDHWVRSGHGDRIALRVLDGDGTRRDISYAQLADRVNRVADVFAEAGLRAGDVVAVLLGRELDCVTAILGALKLRCIVCPVFTAFGPEPIRSRLLLGHAAALVTSPGIHERKVAPWWAEAPELRHVFVTGDVVTQPPGTISLDAALNDAHVDRATDATTPDDLALLLFTSGTTGLPKGALHAHGLADALIATAREVLGLREGDVSWCTADPGWVTGIAYGILAPLLCGATALLDPTELDPAHWYTILAEEDVAVWYTSPTAMRMLMRAGSTVPGIHRPHPRLRLAATVGEPLEPAAIEWAQRELGIELHDTWWQTETGAIVVANPIGEPVRVGSMGRPLHGIGTAIVRCDEDGVPARSPDGQLELLDGPAIGMLALDAATPSLWRGYLDDRERDAACFATGRGARWYLTGDLVRRDHEGALWFIGRADDVIKSSGHLIGPSEVERVLNEHPAVVDSGVYGVPDAIAGSLVHAVVVLADGVPDDATTRASILGYARRRLGATVAPRRILAVDELPRTRSGKTLRRVLIEREHDVG